MIAFNQSSDVNSILSPLPDPAPGGEEVESVGRPAAKLTKAQAQTVKRRLQMSERFKDKTFKPHYERCNKLYLGQHWENWKVPAQDPRVVVNYILPNIETKVASLAFSQPEFIVNAGAEAYTDQAAIAKAAIGYEWKLAHVQRECKRVLKDKEMYGFGVLFTGWLFETDELIVQDGRPPVEGEPVDPEQTLANLMANDPQAPVPAQTIREDRFFVKRLNPFHFLPDPEGTWVLDDHQYCGYIEVRPLDDVKADKRYKNTRQLKGSKKNLEGYFSDEMKNVKDDSDLPSDVLRVRLLHYYEKRRQIHAVMTDEHELPLMVEPWVWSARKYPFVSLANGLGEEDQFYQLPGAELLAPMQYEINQIRSKMHTSLKRYNRTFLAPKGWLDAQAKKQLKSGEDGAIVEHTGNSSEPVVAMNLGVIPQEIFQADTWAKEDMRAVSAVNEYEQGLPSGGRKTAREVQAIQQGGGARMMQDAQRFEAFCGEVARHCLWWLQQNATRTRELPIYDADQNVAAWKTYTGQDIRGDFMVDVYVGSTQVKNREDVIQDVSFLLQSLAPFFQMPDPATGGPLLDPRPLLQQLLKSLPDIRNVEAILHPAPPPAPPMLPGAPGMTPGMTPGMLPHGAGPGPSGPPPTVGPVSPVQILAAHNAGLPIPPELLAALGQRRG